MPTDPIRRLVRDIALAALWLIPAASAHAQGASPLAPGARVRVTIRDAYPGRTTGALIAIGGDTMRYTPDGDTATRVVLLGRVRQLEVSRGVHRHTLQGFVTGAAIGALTGVATGYASGDDPKQAFLSMTRGDKAALLGAGLGVIGGGIGTIIGFAHRSEVWRPVQPPYTVTLAPGRGGMRVGMRLAF